MPESYIRQPNIACVICGNEVYRRPVEIARNHGKAYCSMGCYGKSIRKEKPCVVCGKLMMSSLNKKTCSHVCANIHRTGIKYKLGRPRKDKVIKGQLQKLRLIKARGSVCERCGYNKVEILQVHHKDKNRDHNDLDNLELICPNCHYEEHYLEKSWLKKIDI